MLALLAIICTGGVKAAVGDTYKLVTSVDDLKAGDVIVIGCADKNSVMSSFDSNKQRWNGTDITISSNIFSCANAAEITLSGNSDAWYLKTSEGYLLGMSTTKLNVSSTKASSTKAAISFENNNAIITFSGITGRHIQRNSTYDYYACYASAKNSRQAQIQIYKKQDSGKTATTTTFGAGFDGKTFTFTDGVLEGFTAPEATWTPTEVGGSVAYSSSDKDIVTVDNGGKLNFTNTKFGTATITATFTPSGQDNYAKSTATYTVINTHIYNSIADLKKAITSTSTTNPDELKINLTDAVVTYVNGSNAFIQDATAGILVYMKNHGLNAGDKFTGVVDVKACIYKGLPEITSWKPSADIAKTENVDIPVTEVTLADIAGDNYSKYESVRVKVINVEVTSAMNGQDAKISQNGTELAVRAGVTGLKEMDASQHLDIVGYPGVYNTTIQLNVWEQSDITIHQEAAKADPEIAFKETEKTVELKEGAIELSTLISNPHTLPVTYISSNDEVAEVSEGVIYMYKTGKVDITAKFAGNDKYNATEKTLALTIVDNRADAGIHFEKDSYTADINKNEFSGAVLVNPNSLKVTYSINPNDETALIDEESGLVTYTKGTEASYEVTAKFSGNDTYKPVTATYTLNVTDPNYEVKTVTFDVTVDKGTTTGTEADAMNKGGVYVTSTSAALGRDDEYRLYGGSTHTFSVKTGKITKIEFVGNSQKYPLVNLKLKEENGTFSATALAATWTGNSDNVVFTTEAQVRATKITVTVKAPVAKDVALDEEKDNVVEAAENANVTLKRTLYADGGWNTLCLPFTLTDAQAKAAFGNDVELRTLESVSGNTLTFASATGITAGVPYLIKVSKVAGDNTYTFTGVTTIAVKEKMDFGSSGKKNNVEFVGIYSPADVSEWATAGKENALFLGAANKFYKAKAGTPMKGFRAFFLVPASTDTQALRAVIDGTTTGIDDLNIDTVKADGRVYNLNGQCVGYSLEGLKAGIYIQNGKKVIKK